MVVEGVGDAPHRPLLPADSGDEIGKLHYSRGGDFRAPGRLQQLAEHTYAGADQRGGSGAKATRQEYSLVVRVEANDRSGLPRDITTILANEKSTCWASPAAATLNGRSPPLI